MTFTMKTTYNTKNKYRYSQRPGRRVVVGNINWKWECSSSGAFLAYSEHGHRVCAHADEVDGRDFARGQWKRSREGAFTPSDAVTLIARATADFPTS